MAIATFPLFYFKDFYEHFLVYLTGTVLINIIRNQWILVVLSILLFSAFLVPLTYRKRAKWVDYSLGTAFFVSLFIEMYGVPFTLVFASKFLFKPGVELPPTIINFNMFGIGIGMDLAMVYSAVVMLVGMILITLGWITLYRGVKKKQAFVHTGIYKISRHPQYLGFILVLLGWLIGWPTILTIIFVPILIYKYTRVSITEEKEMLGTHQEYNVYKEKVPFFI